MPYVSFSPSRETLLNRASLASGRRIGYFLAVIGLISLGWGDYLFCQERIFLTHAKRTTARVVQLREQRSRSGLSCVPVFAYTDGTGKEWRTVTGESAYPPAFALGQTAEVFFSPNDPGRGQLDSFFGRWGVALVLGIGGAVFALIGYIGTGVFEWLERTTRFP